MVGAGKRLASPGGVRQRVAFDLPLRCISVRNVQMRADVVGRFGRLGMSGDVRSGTCLMRGCELLWREVTKWFEGPLGQLGVLMVLPCRFPHQSHLVDSIVSNLGRS